MRRSLSLASLGLAAVAVGSGLVGQLPAERQRVTLVLEGLEVHSLEGAPIVKGTVVVRKGKIDYAGPRVEHPEGEDIDAPAFPKGSRLYPAFVLAQSVLGLVEINAVRSTRDFAEVGGMSPEVRAEVAFRPDSELLPVARANGIALALTVPQGGTLSGSSALMSLDGWTWEDMAIQAPIGMHLRWPSMRLATGEKRDESRKKRDSALAEIREFFARARAYLDAKLAEGDGAPFHATDRRLVAMVPCLTRRVPLFVHADGLREIEAAVDFARAQNLRLVLVGARDAWRCTDVLRENSVAVIVGGTLRLPGRRDEAFDSAYRLPQKLYEAGVDFCIAGSGAAFDAAHERNLPYQAAMAAAYGLPAVEALRAITTYPARILGVGDRFGTIAKGKDATLIVTDGDPLEIRTRVLAMYIEGRRIDLDSRHERLNRKYREKYRRLGILSGRKVR